MPQRKWQRKKFRDIDTRWRSGCQHWKRRSSLWTSTKISDFGEQHRHIILIYRDIWVFSCLYSPFRKHRGRNLSQMTRKFKNLFPACPTFEQIFKWNSVLGMNLNYCPTKSHKGNEISISHSQCVSRAFTDDWYYPKSSYIPRSQLMPSSFISHSRMVKNLASEPEQNWGLNMVEKPWVYLVAELPWFST